eukprot:4234091-Prorocentrum_lima.AAC.1
MARDFPLPNNLEASDFFNTVFAAMDAQRPGQVPGQGGQPLQAQQGQQQVEVQLQMQHMDVGQQQSQQQP